MEDLDSVFMYHEGEHLLRQKLMNVRHELEDMKNVKTELLNLLKITYQERDEARCQIQKLMNPTFMPFTTTPPTTTTHLQNMFDTQSHHNLMFPSSAKANSSITESDNSSSQVESFFDTVVSSPEFTNNINNAVVVDPVSKMSYLNQHLFSFSSAPPHHASMMVPMCDSGDASIDSLAKKRGFLPQKGKLLQAVIDAGPLLKTLLLAGPLPTWRNPPSLQNIKVPPLAIKKCDDAATTFGESGNSLVKKQKLLPPLLHYSNSNAPSTCSASMLNFASGQTNASLNNTTWQLNSTLPGVSIQVPSSKRQRHQ